MKLLLASTILAIATPALAQPAPPEQNTERIQRAKFSGKRLVLEILVGGGVQALAAYGTYSSVCGDDPCLGGALGGWFAGFAVTPLAVWGTGTLTGGEGKLSHAYYGAVPALAPFSATTAPVGLQFGLSAILLPITSSFMYELSSHVASQRWTAEHAPQLTVRASQGGYAGAFAVRF